MAPGAASRRHGVPETLTIAGSEAKAAAIRSANQAPGTAIARRQGKYLNHLMEQDQPGVKRMTRPLHGGQSFNVAPWTLTGLELRHRLRQGPRERGAEQGLTRPAQFYGQAASSRAPQAARDHR
jgi:transposase-like protein